MRNSLFILLSCLLGVNAQFAPNADSLNTTAIHKDSSIILSWADYTEVHRGPMHIAQPELGLTTVGDANFVLGPADGSTVVSLGDGGYAIVGFWEAIQNGPGPDFVVFENGFDNFFLELAFVEVSTDGVNYVRFPATSHTPVAEEVGSFDSLDCTHIHNLAGKYRAQYGTPFDLEDLIDSTGIDLQDIHFIKVIDVVGSTNPLYASYDHLGQIINDPYPTPFPNGGFDLEAIGKINGLSTGISHKTPEAIQIYPNPLERNNVLHIKNWGTGVYQIYDSKGALYKEGNWAMGEQSITLEHPGLYILHFNQQNYRICVY